jgi:hypothetical protein
MEDLFRTQNNGEFLGFLRCGNETSAKRRVITDLLTLSFFGPVEAEADPSVSAARASRAKHPPGG